MFLIRVVTVAVLVGLWEALGRSGYFYAGVLPPTWRVVQAIIEELSDQSFYYDMGITLLESVVGFVFGSAIALLLAVALGTNSYLRRMIEPYIVAIAGTPKIIFLPILFLIFGLGLESKMAKAAISAFFPVVLNVSTGIVNINPVLLRVGQSFGLTLRQMVTKVYIPAVIHPLFTGLRLGVAMAIIGVLSAEISYSNSGVGYRLIHDADQFRIPSVYALTILIFAVSAVINTGLTRLQDRLSRHEARPQTAANVQSLAALEPAAP